MNFVTGNLIYQTAYDYYQNEIVRLKYLNKTVSIVIDDINNNSIADFLKYCGVPAADIIIAKGYGSSTRDRVEIFFAYVGTIPGGTQDLWIENAHHAYASYARQNGIIMPAYQNINQGLDNIALKLASDYPVISFMVKPFSLPTLPGKVLAKTPINGTLADMRNIPNSYQHVVPFKKLNWEILWYMDASGKQKTERRPKSGWII
ncbi:MAG: hypothetical protein IPK91_02620 [Saprospiraceae bacterium]|nr:hypothetical protein [Saprospiraceae bacterium]MBK8296183.1 hypothetical protein [Saprospiraceae bacterium]